MNEPSANPSSASAPRGGLPQAYAAGPAYYGGAPVVPYYGETQSDSGPLNTLDPLRLLGIVRKKWLTILLAVLFAGGAGTFYLGKATRLYMSQATIELSVRRPRILNKQEAMIEDPAAIMQIEDTLNTQIEKFKSKTMLPHVVASYRLLYPEDKFSDDELSRRLAGRANFAMMKRTRLVRVSCMSRIPEFAIKACNAYAAGAEASTRAENKEVSDAAVAWLEAQATAQKNKLEAADRALLDARQQHQMDVMTGQRKTVESALQGFNDALVQIESKAALEKKLLEAFEAAELNPESAGKLPADIPRAADVGVSLERWRAAVTERDALLSSYTPEHPTVVAQDKAVELYRSQAMAALKRAKTTAAANLALYEEQTEGLRKKKEEQLKLASDLDRAILDGGMNIAALERERSAADSSYMGVLFRIQEARLSADENTATVKLVESASAARQIQPRPLRTLFISLLLGFGLGFGLAFLADMMEDHVMGANDIETSSGTKILAIIPHAKTKNRREIATASLTHRFSEMAEAFAGLRSVLDSAVYRPHTKMILVASSLPEEGKTTTCCNLAITCALNGQKTLLLDFDLRRPRVGGIFPMPAGYKGLLDYLANGQADPQEIVYPARCNNLSVIASRVVDDARPAELVGGPKVANLLAWARAHFDRILIDAPPLGIVSDALSLAGLADCVLVMARPAASRKRAVRHTIRRFHDVGVGNVAVVMNDVDHSKFSYHGYGPYYHYRKHYASYASAAPAAEAGNAEIRQDANNP